MSYIVRHLICIICCCIVNNFINCEFCIDTRREVKLRDFHRTRRNYLHATNVSLHINYFDVSIVTRETLNVIHSTRESVRFLDLSHNRINEIYCNAFDELVALEVLRLSNNFIEKLNNNHFGDLHELIGLDLSTNLIETINVNAFAKLKNLLWLNIAHNCLLNVALNLPVRALHSLNIAHNLINEFPQLSGGINTITMLNLSHNKILDLEIEFASIKALSRSIQSLDISDNQLRHPNQLITFANLQELNLANNEEIDYVENGKFIRHLVTSLRKLNLTNTNLTSLEIFLHVDGAQFTELSLGGNPISCDFEELSKFSHLVHLEIQQKLCHIYNDYRAIRRNFRELKSVKIHYNNKSDVERTCNCIEWNKIQFKFVDIEYVTNWNACYDKNDPDCGQSMKIDVNVMIILFVVVKLF